MTAGSALISRSIAWDLPHRCGFKLIRASGEGSNASSCGSRSLSGPGYPKRSNGTAQKVSIRVRNRIPN
jgi:hypothetical protein